MNSQVDSPPSGSYDDKPLKLTSDSVSESETIERYAVGSLPMKRVNEPSLFVRLPSATISSLGSTVKVRLISPDG